MTLLELKWATQRILFYAYIAFSMITVVGGFLTAPLIAHLVFGDWRFWRYWRYGWRLYPHAWKMASYILRGENEGFMLSVPLTAAPLTSPDPGRTRLNPTWRHGYTCDTCSRCCEKINCPLLRADGLCDGYDSFFWRYFNCGRFPSAQREIDYYACPKWIMGEARSARERAAAGG